MIQSQSASQVNCIVSPQAMLTSQLNGSIYHQLAHLHQGILRLGILHEFGQELVILGKREKPTALFARQGRCNLDKPMWDMAKAWVSSPHSA
jgi:hypothetical protein